MPFHIALSLFIKSFELFFSLKFINRIQKVGGGLNHYH